MQRQSPSSLKNSLNIELFAKKIQSGKYFRKINLFLIKEMLTQGKFVSLNKEEFLIQEKESNISGLIVLLEGSLIVTSKDDFIMRLNQPGDVLGEMSIIYPYPKLFADVISEERSKVVIFPNHIFNVSENDTKVSIAYFVFSHILAEKLRQVSAHKLLKKNIRPIQDQLPVIGILDSDKDSRKKIISALKFSWGKTRLIELESYTNILNNPLEKNFDLFIFDPNCESSKILKKEPLRNLIENCRHQMTQILVVSQFCKKEDNRKFLFKLGVNDFLTKPFSDFDLQLKFSKFRKDYYLQKEFEQIGIEADTDRLTGLANRRKMDEFLEAMIIIFSEDKKPFSIIIVDVDFFKHYNDTHGHQLGDVVLTSVASILKKGVRRGDLVSRYGGDEFVIILPNCSKSDAIKIGNKLRKSIANEKIQFQDQQPLGNLTCTFGVSNFPHDANNKEKLLKKADKFLYKGKSDGRNKLVSSD